MEILPWYTVEQLRMALLHHVWCTSDHFHLRRSEWERLADKPLGHCLVEPFTGNLDYDEDSPAIISRSYGYASKLEEQVDQARFRGGIWEHEGDLWAELSCENLVAIMTALAQGKGRLVLRVWYDSRDPGNTAKYLAVRHQQLAEEESQKRRWAKQAVKTRERADRDAQEARRKAGL